MSTLTKKKIVERLQATENGLIVTPLLSERHVGDSSIDVRLGTQFIIFRTHMCGVFAPYKEGLSELRRLQERQVVKFGSKFVLHPGTLALGATFEYFSIPADLECQVEGRSSWARVGLQIATANYIEPGFRGVITLELSNVGRIPLEFYPGVRIAQVVFREAKPLLTDPYAGERKYRCPVGPQFSKIREDRDGQEFMRGP